jgi:hypothetical protein
MSRGRHYFRARRTLPNHDSVKPPSSTDRLERRSACSLKFRAIRNRTTQLKSEDQVTGILKRQSWFNEVEMNYGNIHSWSVNLDRRIALALRRDPKLLGVLEHRLRSKMATARSAAAVGENDWEWYVMLTFWSPLKVIRLLEDSSEQTTRLRKTSPLLYLLSDSERRQLLSLSFLAE